MACRKGMDLFGAFVLAFITAVGGGSIRDILLNSGPVFWIKDINYILVIIATTVITLPFSRWHKQFYWPIQLLDALGLAVFTVIGISKALALGASPIIAIMMGTLTGCGGGALRDLLAGEVPVVLRKEIYAFAAIAGGGVHVMLLPVLGSGAQLTGITLATVLIIRVVSLYKGYSIHCHSLTAITPPGFFSLLKPHSGFDNNRPLKDDGQTCSEADHMQAPLSGVCAHSLKQKITD